MYRVHPAHPNKLGSHPGIKINLRNLEVAYIFATYKLRNLIVEK